MPSFQFLLNTKKSLVCYSASYAVHAAIKKQICGFSGNFCIAMQASIPNKYEQLNAKVSCKEAFAVKGLK